MVKQYLNEISPTIYGPNKPKTCPTRPKQGPNNAKKGPYDQKQIIAQYNIDLDEIEFLRLNLKFGHTCRKSFLNNEGFEVGTLEYKSCVMNKVQTND